MINRELRMNNVQVLKDKGFTVTTNSNAITLESAQPFKVVKRKKSVEAHKTDTGYTLTVEGLILNDTVPFVVESVSSKHVATAQFAFLSSLLETVTNKKKTNKTPFFSIGLNETFKIDGDDTLYVRDGMNSYRKHSNLISVGVSTTVNESFTVIMEGSMFDLSPEQVMDLAHQIPADIHDQDEVYEVIHSMLEDVPGMEDYEVAQVAADQVYNAYISIHSAQ